MNKKEIRHNWTISELEEIYNEPFNDLLWSAHQLHRNYHDPNEVQISTLMSII